MPKLHLKRTPEEEAAHQLRKKQRREAKAKRRPPRTARSSSSPEPGPYPSTSYKVDPDAIRAELEEQRFREKMSVAFEDDERLDSVEARFNDFAHVPHRWGGGSSERSRFEEDDDGRFMKMDPATMDEEEYIEWVRAGMFRKTHAEEFEEKKRRKAEKAERQAREKALRAETKRIEKAAEEERRRRKREKENRRWDYAREEYHLRWKELSGPGLEERHLEFWDIPWPVLAAHKTKKGKIREPYGVEDLTMEAISTFLFPNSSSSAEEEGKKERKDKLRETFLRFHPDKFEGRLMKRVKDSEQDKVREGLGQVVRVLNDLMGEGI